MTRSNMYDDTVTWNPFKGCRFGCSYCKPSFQAQAKRQKKNCLDCYAFTPHEHEDRLTKIPKGKRVFVCGNGDIAFASPSFLDRIVGAVASDAARYPGQEYYFQSKAPIVFKRILSDLPDQAVLVTTLETNRDCGYRLHVGNAAPEPTRRWSIFRGIDYPRKVVTVEPIMDFDLHTFAGMLMDLEPEAVWIGFNSRPKQIKLPEPDEGKVVKLIDALLMNGIPVRGKDLRGIVPSMLDITGGAS